MYSMIEQKFLLNKQAIETIGKRPFHQTLRKCLMMTKKAGSKFSIDLSFEAKKWSENAVFETHV